MYLNSDCGLTALSPFGASAGHLSLSSLPPLLRSEAPAKVQALSFPSSFQATATDTKAAPTPAVTPAVCMIAATSLAATVGSIDWIPASTKSNRPPGLASSATLWANLWLASHACRFLRPPQAASASLASLFKTSRSFGENAMLTSPGAISFPLAVAVTATIAAGTVVTDGWLSTVVVYGRSVRYSVFTPIH